MKRKGKYEVVEVESLDDICDIIYHNTDYLVKQNKKLNRKVNALTVIFGGILFSTFHVLAEEVENLKIKCK